MGVGKIPPREQPSAAFSSMAPADEGELVPFHVLQSKYEDDSFEQQQHKGDERTSHDPQEDSRIGICEHFHNDNDYDYDYEEDEDEDQVAAAMDWADGKKSLLSASSSSSQEVCMLRKAFLHSSPPSFHGTNRPIHQGLCWSKLPGSHCET
jgi:hypothetical protein